jgi:hypothetical protein
MTLFSHNMFKAFRHQFSIPEGEVVVWQLLIHCEEDISHWLQGGSGRRVVALCRA